MLTNVSARQCAFVEDIHQCSQLPQGWTSSGEVCPVDFAWVDGIACLDDEAASPTAAQSTLPEAAVTAAQEDGTSAATQTALPTPEEKSSPTLPCASLGAALVGLLWLRVW